jgi:hypothetical protein
MSNSHQELRKIAGQLIMIRFPGTDARCGHR